MTDVSRYTGFDPDGVAETEADHFGNCPVCGGVSRHARDLGQVLAHVHEAEIEIGEGPVPPRREQPLRQSRSDPLPHRSKDRDNYKSMLTLVT
jgi:hypothetical protein